jgi:hypothetical protein
MSANNYIAIYRRDDGLYDLFDWEADTEDNDIHGLKVASGLTQEQAILAAQAECAEHGYTFINLTSPPTRLRGRTVIMSGMVNVKCLMTVDKYKEGIVYPMRQEIATLLVEALPQAFEWDEDVL